MAGLALKLAPKERVLINGVVVENGPRRAQLLIKTDNAAVLRLRDALDQSDVVGPASEAYYTAQRSVAGEITEEEAKDLLAPLLLILFKLPESALRPNHGSSALVHPSPAKIFHHRKDHPDGPFAYPRRRRCLRRKSLST